VKTTELLDGKLCVHLNVLSHASVSDSGVIFSLQDRKLLSACKKGNVPTVTDIVKQVKDGSEKLTVAVRTNQFPYQMVIGAVCVQLKLWSFAYSHTSCGPIGMVECLRLGIQGKRR
jgi:hypothetical protein